MANLQVNQQNTKRIALSELSKQVAPMVAAGQFDKVNEALIACYQSTEHRYFKTFNQWRREGYQVKKGSHAFLVWARPKTKFKKAGDVVTAEKDYSFFPLCFLFSNAQVEPFKIVVSDEDSKN